MSLEEHRGSGSGSVDESEPGAAPGVAAEIEKLEIEEDDESVGGGGGSAANVIPREKLANGLQAARGLWSATVERAKKGLADLNENETVIKVRESTRPVVSAVVEGAKSVKPHLETQGERIKEGLQPVMEQVGGAIQDAAQRSKPALEAAGTSIKTTAVTVAEQAKPVAERVGVAVAGGLSTAATWVQNQVGKGKGGGGGPTTV